MSSSVGNEIPASSGVALAGTAALVTGASSGIGAATAIALGQRGARVALVARRKDRLDAVGERIREQGGVALELEADISDQDQATGAVQRAVAEFGRLDTLVNNAGIMLLGPALGSSVEDWEQMVALNVMGSLYVTHAALPHLVSAAENSPRRVADLVNISSTAGRLARPGAGVYALTKFGLTAFSESLRQELIAQRRSPARGWNVCCGLGRAGARVPSAPVSAVEVSRPAEDVVSRPARWRPCTRVA